jgi:hypothetical protein
MIKDPAVSQEIKDQWAAIQKLIVWNNTLCVGFVMFTSTPPDEFYNLPLVLAYCTLDDVLGQFITEGTVTCTQRSCFFLGAKMKSAEKQITWIDYALIDKGLTARNDLAHRSKLATKADALKYVDGIEADMRAWQIVK